MKESEIDQIYQKYRKLFRELIADRNKLFIYREDISHEEYRVYEALQEMIDILLDLNDYLYASKNEKVTIYTNKKVIE